MTTDSLIMKAQITEMNNPIQNNQIQRAAQVRKKKLACSICGNDFKTNGELNYFYNVGGAIHLICDKCQEKIDREWRVVDVLEFRPDKVTGLNNQYYCKFADGSLRWVSSSNGYGQTSSGFVVPQIYFDSIKPFIEAYMNTEREEKCIEVIISDTYDEQSLTARFGNNENIKIEFKVVGNEIRYNPKNTEFLTNKQIDEINRQLKDQYVFNHYIPNKKQENNTGIFGKFFK